MVFTCLTAGHNPPTAFYKGNTTSTGRSTAGDYCRGAFPGNAIGRIVNSAQNGRLIIVVGRTRSARVSTFGLRFITRSRVHRSFCCALEAMGKKLRENHRISTGFAHHTFTEFIFRFNTYK